MTPDKIRRQPFRHFAFLYFAFMNFVCVHLAFVHFAFVHFAFVHFALVHFALGRLAPRVDRRLGSAAPCRPLLGMHGLDVLELSQYRKLLDE